MTFNAHVAVDAVPTLQQGHQTTRFNGQTIHAFGMVMNVVPLGVDLFVTTAIIVFLGVLLHQCVFHFNHVFWTQPLFVGHPTFDFGAGGTFKVPQ